MSQAASIASGRTPGRGWLLSAGTPLSFRIVQTRPSSGYSRQGQGRQDRPQTPSPFKDHPRRTMPRCWLTHRRDIIAHGLLPRHPSLTRHSTRKRHASPSFLGMWRRQLSGKPLQTAPAAVSDFERMQETRSGGLPPRAPEIRRIYRSPRFSNSSMFSARRAAAPPASKKNRGFAQKIISPDFPLIPMRKAGFSPALSPKSVDRFKT